VPLLLLGPPFFLISLFGSTTLLTGMTCISLHIQWPLTSQSDCSFSQREQVVFRLQIKLHAQQTIVHFGQFVKKYRSSLIFLSPSLPNISGPKEGSSLNFFFWGGVRSKCCVLISKKNGLEAFSQKLVRSLWSRDSVFANVWTRHDVLELAIVKGQALKRENCLHQHK
jgi:hypothetical protein